MADAPAEQETQEDKTDKLIEAVDPPKRYREQRIAGLPETLYENFDKTYRQQRLSMLGHIQLASVIGKAVRSSLSGENPMTLQELGLGGGSLTQADAFIRGLSQLSENAPDLFTSLYLIILSVPGGEREIVADILEQPPSEDGRGGMTLNDGMEILTTFFDQNGPELVQLFRQKAPKMWEDIQQSLNQTKGSSKPSKNSRRRTQ